MMFAELQKYLVYAAIFMGLIVISFFQGVRWEVKKCQEKEEAYKLKAAEVYQAEVKKNAQLSADLVSANAQVATVFKRITSEVQRVVQRPIYTSCKLDADGLRLWNDANRGTKATDTAKPYHAVPAATRNESRNTTRDTS